MGKLFQSRQQRVAKAAAAAAGTAPAPTTHFSEPTRTKILWAMAKATPRSIGRVEILADWSTVAARMQMILFEEWGRTTGLSNQSGVTADGDVSSYAIHQATDQEMLDIIEAWIAAALDPGTQPDAGALLPPSVMAEHRVRGPSILDQSVAKFRDRVNDILDDEDIAYQIVGTEIVERSSLVMHADVVEPLLSLLDGDPRLDRVEIAFTNALRELKPEGQPADAITDAATALQEMLDVLGADGNALGPKMKSAVKKGWLRPYDAKLVDWASAARSDQGDAHSASEPSKDDAWLVVHVVGALILKLKSEL